MNDAVATLYRRESRRVFATTVRVRGGEVTLFDGPFAETKAMLAGFYLVDAKDLNEAIQIAAGIPPARCGSIEVRPVRELQTGA